MTALAASLTELAAAMPGLIDRSGDDVTITGLAHHSRAVKPGDLFLLRARGRTRWPQIRF